MSLEIAQVLDRLHGALQKLERAVHLHEQELEAMRDSVKAMERDRRNAEKVLRQQVVGTREQLDVLEQNVANLRAARRSRPRNSNSSAPRS